MTATITPKRTAAKKAAAGTARLPAAHETDYPTPKERSAVGKQQRKELPLAAQAEVARDPSRPGPVELLEQQCTTRVQELVPVRYGRMAVSPFTFYRGAARVMASDLAAAPHSALKI